MAIKTKFKLKQGNGSYETYHFETDASQVITNSNQLFCSQTDKNSWNSKETTSGAQAKADAAKNSAIASAKSYTDSVASGKANTNHTHTGYASTNHTHTGYASSDHSHSNYALTSHTHSGYASSSHNHDGSYLSRNGGNIYGSISGDMNSISEVHYRGVGNNVNAGLYINQDGRVGFYDWKHDRGLWQYNSGNGIIDFSRTCIFYGKLRADSGIYMGENDRITRTGSAYYFDIQGHWRNSQLQSGQLYIQPWSTEETALCVNRDGERTNGRTDLTIVPSKSNYGIFGRSSRYWYVAWSTGWRTPSYRKSKYDIMRTDEERLYQCVKDINIYNYRRISGNPEDEKTPDDYRGDLQMGAMINELPFEVVDHDTEHGEGKGVDLYGYSSMIAGALKATINRVEKLQEENEELRNKLNEMGDKLDGFIQK